MPLDLYAYPGLGDHSTPLLLVLLLLLLLLLLYRLIWPKFACSPYPTSQLNQSYPLLSGKSLSYNFLPFLSNLTIVVILVDIGIAVVVVVVSVVDVVPPPSIATLIFLYRIISDRITHASDLTFSAFPPVSKPKPNQKPKPKY